MLSVLGLNLGFMVKYAPLPSVGVYLTIHPSSLPNTDTVYIAVNIAFSIAGCIAVCFAVCCAVSIAILSAVGSMKYSMQYSVQ